MNSGLTSETSRICRVYSQRTDPSRYGFFHPSTLLASQERERKILAALARHGQRSLERRQVIEVGCGTGFWLREFVRWGARPENIFGVDLIPERIAEARALCPARVTLTCGSAEKLEFSAGSFDLVFQSTVFTSILEEMMKVKIAGEMLRVLRPGGLIVWYDFTVNNPWNSDVRGIPRREVKRLFPGCQFEFERLTLAPPMGRRIARFSSFLYRAVSAVKVFDTHCLAIIRKTC
jgi:ubiquinone/menaquinone biosynthesis C-methylase UbiE